MASEAVDAVVETFHRGVVAPDVLLRGALAIEARDVGAGHEGLVARPGQDHDPDGGIPLERLEDHLRRLPHVQRHGVALRDVVEGHDADGAAPLA